MKKLVLLFAIGSLAMTASAQESTSVLLTRPGAKLEAKPGTALSVEFMNKIHEAYLTRQASQRTGAAKTSTSTISEWYDLWNQNYLSGSATGYYWATYSDSNLVDNSSTPYNMFVHGMGMSFDPTDSSYFSFSSTVNGGALQIGNTGMMPTGQAYTVDSFYKPIQYLRKNATPGIVDSIIIELVVATNTAITGSDTGAYNLKFSYSSANTCYAADGTPRFASSHYNSGYGTFWFNHPAPYNAAPYVNDAYFDSVFVVKERFALALTSAADTDANGFLNLGQLSGTYKFGNTPAVAHAGVAGLYSLHLQDELALTWRQHVVSFVSFKSGVAYPLGTLGTAANWIKLFAGSPLGGGTASCFQQSSSNGALSYPGSYQAGLIAQDQIRYCDTGFTYPHGTHDILIPGNAFSSPDLVVTEEAFHIKWTGVPTGVSSNVVAPINTVNVYPNPAANELNVTYTGADNSPVTVTLSNMLGQVVATQTVTNGKAVFNTAKLTNGVYIYSLNANGTREGGRVLIAH
jgi:Secretion system C-terminal sorting domain